MCPNFCQAEHHWATNRGTGGSSKGEIFNFSLGQVMSRYKVVKFSGVDSDKSYTVRVSLLLNGKSIATAQKSLKALAKVQPEIQVEAA